MIISVLTLLGLGENAYIKPNEVGIRGFHGRLCKYFPKTNPKLVITSNNAFKIGGADFTILYSINGEHISVCAIIDTPIE